MSDQIGFYSGRVVSEDEARRNNLKQLSTCDHIEVLDSRDIAKDPRKVTVAVNQKRDSCELAIGRLAGIRLLPVDIKVLIADLQRALRVIGGE